MSLHEDSGGINAAGLSIIKSFEGFSNSVYKDPIGIPTIGYGSIWDAEGKRVTLAHPDITEGEAEYLLEREVRHTEAAVHKLFKAPLNDNQFSAIVSLGYNIGTGNLQASTLKMKVNRLDYEGAAAEFPKWRKAGGRVLPGLVRRRAAERELFEA